MICYLALTMRASEIKIKNPNKTGELTHARTQNRRSLFNDAKINKLGLYGIQIHVKPACCFVFSFFLLSVHTIKMFANVCFYAEN